MWLERTSLHTRVTKAEPAEKLWLAEFLSFDDERARFAGKLRKGRPSGDGKVRLYNVLTDAFPSGLLPIVKKGAADKGLACEVLDKRARPCADDPTADLSWLHDYQLDAVKRAASATTGILWMPTGSGKTEVAIGLTLLVPTRWLFLVPNLDLLEQTAARYELRTGRKAGRVGDGQWTEERFTVATFQTVARALASMESGVVARAIKLVSGSLGLIIDEAHVTPADSFWRVAMKATSAYWRIGMSGTPLARGDRRSLLAVAATGPVIYRVRQEVLVERGVIARARVRMLPCMQVSGFAPTWNDAYRELVVTSAPRNRLIVETAKRAAKPALVFVKDIDHGDILVKAMNAAGVRTEFVSGGDDTDERRAATARLERGELDALVASVVFQQGIDIPSLASVIVAAGGKSTIATLQRIGRGMRTDGGQKMEFEVYDVLDRGNKWLEKHAKMRQRAFLKEGHEVVVESAATGQVTISAMR